MILLFSTPFTFRSSVNITDLGNVEIVVSGHKNGFELIYKVNLRHHSVLDQVLTYLTNRREFKKKIDNVLLTCVKPLRVN